MMYSLVEEISLQNKTLERWLEFDDLFAIKECNDTRFGHIGHIRTTGFHESHARHDNQSHKLLDAQGRKCIVEE